MRVGHISIARRYSYQGWFACPSDSWPGGWFHWFARKSGDPASTTVEMLPDTTELDADERCPSGLRAADGRQIYLFSSRNPKTVLRHFRWMQQYGLDGVALQRFVNPLADPARLAGIDRVLGNVRQAAEATGRVFFVMYDVAGANGDWAGLIARDWARLAQQDRLTLSPSYQRHRGKPVLGITGIGFRPGHSTHPGSPAEVGALIATLRQESQTIGGVTLFGGVPPGWRTLDEGAQPDPAWTGVYRSFDVLSPWTVGHYRDDAGDERYVSRRIQPDLAETKRLGIDYMPVVFPGTSFTNLLRWNHQSGALNAVPRRCGELLWHSATAAVGAGATMLFGAMFDEVDEATAIFKVVARSAELPRTPRYLALDADGCDLPSDWYLRLAGDVARLLRGEIAPAKQLPRPIPGG